MKLFASSRVILFLQLLSLFCLFAYAEEEESFLQRVKTSIKRFFSSNSKEKDPDAPAAEEKKPSGSAFKKLKTKLAETVAPVKEKFKKKINASLNKPTIKNPLCNTKKPQEEEGSPVSST